MLSYTIVAVSMVHFQLFDTVWSNSTVCVCVCVCKLLANVQSFNFNVAQAYYGTLHKAPLLRSVAR